MNNTHQTNINQRYFNYQNQTPPQPASGGNIIVQGVPNLSFSSTQFTSLGGSAPSSNYSIHGINQSGGYGIHYPVGSNSSISGQIGLHHPSAASLSANGMPHMISQQSRPNFRSGYPLSQNPGAPPLPYNPQGLNSKNMIKKRQNEFDVSNSAEIGSQASKKLKIDGINSNSTIESANNNIMDVEATKGQEQNCQIFELSGQQVSKELDEKFANARKMLEEQSRIKPNFMVLSSCQAARLQVDFFPPKLLSDEFRNELRKDLIEDPNCFKRCPEGDSQRKVFCLVEELDKILNVLKLDKEQQTRKDFVEKEIVKKETNESSKGNLKIKNSQALKKKRKVHESDEDIQSGSDDEQDQGDRYNSDSDEQVSHSQSSKEITKKRGRKRIVRKNKKQATNKDDQEDDQVNNNNSDDELDEDNYFINNSNHNNGINPFNEVGVDDQDDEDYSEGKGKKIIVRKKKDDNNSKNLTDGNNNNLRRGRGKHLQIDDDDDNKTHNNEGSSEKEGESKQNLTAIPSSTGTIAQASNNTNTNNNLNHTSQNTSQMEIEGEIKVENRLLKFREREASLSSKEAEFEKRQRHILETQQKIMHLNLAFVAAINEYENAVSDFDIINTQFSVS